MESVVVKQQMVFFRRFTMGSVVVKGASRSYAKTVFLKVSICGPTRPAAPTKNFHHSL